MNQQPTNIRDVGSLPTEETIIPPKKKKTRSVGGPEVSVVVPVFEVEPYIGTCLRSLEAQTIPVQVILVLKKGSDRSCEIAESFAKKNKWKFIYVRDDERQGESRNHGTDIATGEYIAFVDSDDYVPPNAYELMLANIKRSRADVVIGETLRFSEKNRKGWATPKLGMGGIFSERRIIRWEDFPWLVYNGAPWNKLIRTQFLRENNIRFPEKVFYEDVGFALDLYLHNPVISIEPAVVYKWRIRDAKKGKSVTQQKSDFGNLEDRMKVYSWLDGRFSHHQASDKILRAWQHRKVTDLFYYLNDYMKGTAYFRDMFRKVAPQYLSSIEPRVLKQFPLGDRLIARWIKKGQFTKVDTLGEAILFGRETYSIIRKRVPKPIQTAVKYAAYTVAAPFAAAYYFGKVPMQFAKRKRLTPYLNIKAGAFYQLCSRLLPVSKKIFLYEGVSGRQFAGNEKYIYLEMKKRYPRAKHVWAFQQQDAVDRNAEAVKGSISVIRGGWKYLYYLARAGYLFTGTSLPTYFRKRSRATFVQTWHGTPLKTLGFDIEAPVGRELNRNSTENVMYPQSKQWSYFVAPNEFTAEKFASAYKYKGDVLRTGYPRNDIFYWDEDRKAEISERVKSVLNIPEGRKIALYAPTFKDGKRYGNRNTQISFNLDIMDLKNRLGDEWVLVVRAHLLSGGKFDPKPFGDFVRTALVDEYDDPQELCLAADLLITDYSSICFDFANTRKPMMFYCPDLEEYASAKRGFYFDPKEKFPGPFVVTSKEVADYLERADDLVDVYRDKYEAFIQEFCAWEDGKASCRVIDGLGL